jgi:tetratricopeptide (TPR) repeat protein
VNFVKVLLLIVVSLAQLGCESPAQRATEYLDKAQAHYDAGDYVKARLEAQNAAQVEPKNAQARYLLALLAERDGDIKQMFGHLIVAADSDPNNVEARLKLGTLYFVGQAFDKAQDEVDALLMLAPNDARVRLLRARMLLRTGDRTAGLAEVDKALEIDPENADGILLNAAAKAVEDLDAALAMLETAIARMPAEKSRQLRELRVVMLSQSKRLPEVEQSLQELTADFPEQREYHLQLARFYATQGRVDEADSTLRQLAEREPVDLQNQLNYAQFLATQRDVSKAESALRAFIEQSPDATSLRLALGELYEVTKRPDEALKTYAELSKRDPKSVDGLAARNRTAAIQIRAGRTAEGMKVVDGILEDAPDEPTALLLRAGGRFVDNKFDDAIADLRLVLRKDPRNERALQVLARAYIRTNELALAKDTYRRLLELNPSSAEGLTSLASLYAADGNFADAEELLKRRVKDKPDDLLAGGRLVEVLIQQKKDKDAETEARRLAALKGQDGVGDFSLGRALASKKDFAGAAEAFKRSAELRDDDPLALEALAQSLESAGKPQEAITLLNEQLDSDKNQLLARYLLGGLYARSGDSERAEKYLEEVIKEKPDAAIAYLALAGGVYRDDPAARLRTLERGFAAVPGEPQLGMLLGSEYERGKRMDDAIRTYEKVVEKQPEFQPAINNLAALLLDYRTSDDASRTRALELARKLASSENPAVMDTVGWAYYRNGEFQQAISILERVVAKSGDLAVFRYHLGMAYLAAGNKVGAKRELQAALDKGDEFPGRREAAAAMATLQLSG